MTVFMESKSLNSDADKVEVGNVEPEISPMILNVVMNMLSSTLLREI